MFPWGVVVTMHVVVIVVVTYVPKSREIPSVRVVDGVTTKLVRVAS